MKKRVLVVDDEKNSRNLMCEVLNDLGLETLEAKSGREGAAILAREKVDLVITDMRMPDGSGLDLLNAKNEINPEVPLIVVTAYGTAEEAGLALSGGATDFLEKPLDLPTLEEKVKSVLHLDDDKSRENYGLLGDSDEIKEVLSEILHFSKSRATVLIEGESGTGKELAAKAIHDAGGDREEPFIAVNCSNFTDTLLQSELFGHERGAFTGATERHRGKFELAGDGTLFLDEIGTIPPRVQVALLRVLDAKTFERVGGNETINCRARIISATNEDLEALVKEGRFRSDLYNRLNVLHLAMPPLRERKGDVKILTNAFLNRYNEESKKNVKISPLTIAIMEKYAWPGNVRELMHVVNSLVVGCAGSEITPGDLPARIRQPLPQKAASRDLWENLDKMTLDEVAQELIKRKKASGKTVDIIAKELGVSCRTLYRWLAAQKKKEPEK